MSWLSPTARCSWMLLLGCSALLGSQRLARAEPPRYVIAPVQPVDDKTPPQVAAKLTELLFAEADNGALSRVPFPSAAAAAPTLPTEDATLIKRVAEAKALYQRMAFADAAAKLSEVVASWESSLERLRDLEPLVEAYVMLGVVSLALHRDEQARQALGRAVSMRPELHLSTAKYPPKVVRTFDAIRTELLAAPKARLQIASVPGFSAVAVDGRAVGKTPLTVSLPAGRHQLLIRSEGLMTATRVVDLTAGGSSKVVVKLERDQLRAAAETLVRAVARGTDRAKALTACEVTATRSGAAGVIVGAVRVEPDGGYTVSFARIDRGAKGAAAVMLFRMGRDLIEAASMVRTVVQNIAAARGVSGPAGSSPPADISTATSLAGLVPHPPPSALKPPLPPPVEEEKGGLGWPVWVGIGGGVAAAIVTGVVLAITLGGSEDVSDSIVVITNNPGAQ